jgi:hypothetical protein
MIGVFFILVGVILGKCIFKYCTKNQYLVLFLLILPYLILMGFPLEGPMAHYRTIYFVMI